MVEGEAEAPVVVSAALVDAAASNSVAQCHRLRMARLGQPDQMARPELVASERKLGQPVAALAVTAETGVLPARRGQVPQPSAVISRVEPAARPVAP